MYDASDPIRPAASKAGGAYHDPAVHARLQEVATRAIGSFRGVVDAFLVGYAEGKNEEIRRALEEEIERQKGVVETLKAAAAAQQTQSAPGGAQPSAPPAAPNDAQRREAGPDATLPDR